MKKILYVVHRYAPYSGGSENYVRDLAEETYSQGHDVTVFTGQHKGNLNGVKVTDDVDILKKDFDLIVVHGGDLYIQNFVLSNANNIKSPILYLLILPSTSDACLKALNEVKYIGCSTQEDWQHVEKYGVKNKSFQISHSINPEISMGNLGFKEKFNIKTKYMFLSSGGFWKHKGMEELADIFSRLPIKDTTLVLTGYQNENLMPQSTDKIRTILLEDRQLVLDAMRESDLYIMNSYEEGFGLVLLECMLNKTPWIARNLAGASLMKNFGIVFENKHGLMKEIFNFKRDEDKIDMAHKYVLKNHTIKNTVNQILGVI
jgi:glycosyltransferase involved in cell wall biosynthesis